MKRKRRTEILIKGNDNIARKLSKEIIDNNIVKTIEEPNYGLVMVKCRESGQNSLFYLGEVLVTECKVSINSTIGVGLVQGDYEELAYHLAVIDAAYNCELDEVTTWNEILLEEERNIEEREQQEKSRVLNTKVNFSTMDVEV